MATKDWWKLLVVSVLLIQGKLVYGNRNMVSLKPFGLRWEILTNITYFFFCQHTHNFSLPAWLTSNNTYEKLMSFGYDAVQMYIPTLQIARLKGGMLFAYYCFKIFQLIRVSTTYNNITYMFNWISGIWFDSVRYAPSCCCYAIWYPQKHYSGFVETF